MAPKITNAAYKPTTTSARADGATLRRVDQPRTNVGTVSPVVPGRKALAHIRYATLVGGSRIHRIRRGSIGPIATVDTRRSLVCQPTGGPDGGQLRRGTQPQQPRGGASIGASTPEIGPSDRRS